MYFTYCLHTQTLNLTLLNKYDSNKEAWRNLKDDAQDFMINYKNETAELKTVAKFEDLLHQPDGFYFKISNKYPNRGSVFEKKMETIKGSWSFYNRVEPKIQKLFVFMIQEVPKEFLVHEGLPEIRTMTNPRVCAINQLQSCFMDELKVFLDRRRITLEGSDDKIKNIRK